MVKVSIIQRIRKPRKLFVIAIWAILIKTPLLPSCTPVFDLWKESQQYMYYMDGMYVIDSIATDTVVLIKEGRVK